MGSGPLDHPRLLEIEEHLDRAEIDAAQRLLAELGDLPVHRGAITYFATRLLYQRGRLDAAGVVERLRELVRLEPVFPQASAMLGAAERGTLRPDPEGFLRATLEPSALAARESASAAAAPTSSVSEGAVDALPRVEFDPDKLATDRPPSAETDRPAPDPGPRRSQEMPQIPRAPILPRFSAPANLAPSYAPEARSASREFELSLEPPELPHDTVPPSESEPPASSPNAITEPPGAPDEDSDPPEVFVKGHSPESMLARARILWDDGRRESAFSHVERLEHAPLLEPELRAACARFLIEAGEPERAVLQARRAIQDDPRAAPVQLVLAWALVRAARRAPNHETIDEAESVLLRLRAKPGPISALAQALRASILAEKGNAERAITTAKLALQLDPTALDAESAISLACARLGRMEEAQAAWKRLRELSREEAERLSDRLEQLGVALRSTPALPSRSERAAVRLWDRLEIELCNGESAAVISAFERGAARELRGLVGESATDAIPLLATMAAAFFTTEPIWRHFAPYDLSLGSIARVEAVLDVMYGRAPRGARPSAGFPALVMLGSYVGECLRQGYGGKWQGSLALPETVFVDSEHARFAPFHELRLRLEQGKPLVFQGRPGKRARESGAPIAMPGSPPAPWDPAQWPSPHIMPRLGVSFSRSVVGLYCSRFAGGPLDRSLAALASLDSYVALLAPRQARRAHGARWVERASVLIGAYLGEVLHDAAGANWSTALDSPTGPESYLLVLPGGVTTEPVLRVYERLSGKSSERFSLYVARVIDEVEARGAPPVSGSS